MVGLQFDCVDADRSCSSGMAGATKTLNLSSIRTDKLNSLVKGQPRLSSHSCLRS